jgi:hypothetical protein
MNWTITQIKTLNNPISGTIVNASFSVSNGTSVVFGDTNLLKPKVDSFVPIENTTESQVVQWVKDSLDHNIEDKAFSNVKRYELLVEQKTKETEPQITPLPWK